MSEEPQLYLINSQSRKKELFKGSGADGRQVTWYSCGPTVYDAAHLGHARTYVAFDVLRRVIRDYFGYSVKYQMNVTDVDDKIIKRARIHYLMSSYKTNTLEKKDLTLFLSDVETAAKCYAGKLTDPLMLSEKRDAGARILAEAEGQIAEFKAKHGQAFDAEAVERLMNSQAGDLLSEWLDKEHGSEVSQPEIFRQLAAKWEREFFEDMESLGVEAPDVVTRVSDYIDEIVKFVERLIDLEYAYVAPSGSVYFDVTKFTLAGFKYPRLVPEMATDTSDAIAQIADADADAGREKRGPVDFVLWKAWKPGEPFWIPTGSKLAKGRPGWHIECSAMATSAVSGFEPLDIHCGGIDLRFPHHDNELAQTEAFLGLKGDTQGWVRYFLHSGHLTISGLKMAKSLKNFITIRQAFQEMSPRSLRLAFLLQSWSAPMEYSPQTIAQAKEYLRYAKEFYALVMPTVMLELSKKADRGKPTQGELEVLSALAEARKNVHAALCDNVDTKTVLLALRNLMAAVHIYLQGTSLTKTTPDANLLYSVVQFIAERFALFGLGSVKEWLGAGESLSAQSRDTLAGENGEDDVGGARALAVAQVVAEFRDKVREAARKTKDVELLKLCDLLRDEMLPLVGIRLEDRPAGQAAALKLAPIVTKEELAAEQAALAAAKAAEKAAKGGKPQQASKKENEEGDDEENVKLDPSVPPSQIFVAGPLSAKFSKFDDAGFPTHDKDGKELTKTGIKKWKKLHDMHKKKHDAWAAKQPNGGAAQ